MGLQAVPLAHDLVGAQHLLSSLPRFLRYDRGHLALDYLAVAIRTALAVQVDSFVRGTDDHVANMARAPHRSYAPTAFPTRRSKRALRGATGKRSRRIDRKSTRLNSSHLVIS